MKIPPISILGCGNIGSAIARGLQKTNKISNNNIILTRRNVSLLKEFSQSGYSVISDNKQAVKNSSIVLLAVGPSQLTPLLNEIKGIINKEHLIISLVSGVEILQIKKILKINNSIIRAMPNTAAELGESITCLSTVSNNNKDIEIAKILFSLIGETLIINESQMASATALGACGIAFFLRAIRAASQGGIEIGFHSNEAFLIAAQTAKGAASLLLKNKQHPESEIDKVTTPRGATISGLNEMEHQGFSSAMIKGITTSTKKVQGLFNKK